MCRCCSTVVHGGVPVSLTYPVMLRRLLLHEGGYVNHPKDPGGATNKGITQRTYDNWRARQGLIPRDIRLLMMVELEAIYKEEYYNKIKGDKLPPALAFQVFDAAVNSGPTRAIQWLQEALGVVVDGKLGPKTLAAVQSFQVDKQARLDLISGYLDEREGFLRRLDTFKTFGDGWMNRLNQNWQYAKGDVNE